MGRLGSKRALFGIVVLALTCVSLLATAESPETPPVETGAATTESGIPLHCVPGSGVWSDTNGLQLGAALCSVALDECPDFTTISFGVESARASYAHTVRDICKLKPFGGIGRYGLYREGDTLIGVDARSLKIVWSMPIGKVTTGQTPDGRLILHLEDRILFLADGENGPTIDWEYETSEAIEFVWRKDKLFLVEKNALRMWPRLADNKLGEMESVEFAVPMEEEDLYAIDDNGIMRTASGGRRLVTFWFAGGGTRITLNSSEEAKGVGGYPGDVVAVIGDSGQTEVIARRGNLLRDRFVLRYWKLKDKDRGSKRYPRPLVLRDGDLMALDGGIAGKRAAVVSTSGITWRRRSTITYPGTGRMVSLRGKVLTTLHSEGDKAIVRWDVMTGLEISHLPMADITAAELGAPREFIELGRTIMLRDKKGRSAIYDPAANKILDSTGDVSGSLRGPRLLGETHIFTEVTRKKNGKVKRWHTLGAEGKHRTLEPRVDAIDDALNPTERWFGYCVPNEPCELTVPDFVRSLGSNTHWKSVPVLAAKSRTDSVTWLTIGGSLALLLLITIFRIDLGRRGRVHEQPKEDAGSDLDLTASALVDKRGRRYLTDRDEEGFVHKTWTQLPWRLGLTIAAGAIFAGVIGFSHLVLQPFETSLPFWLALSLPIGVATWITVSWGVWTRTHLLRFGHAIEGQWFDSGSPKQSLCYTLENGKTYRLKRGQWKRADLVPIVLFDPSRPRLAAQYTGNGQFAVSTRRDAGRLSGTSVVLDAIRLVVVLAICGALAWLGFNAFHKAFPEPISSWEMSRIEAAGEERQMLEPCLEFCTENGGDEDCVSQCQRRQMGHVFASGGIPLDGDPDLLPSAFRAQQLLRVRQVLSFLDAKEEGRSCSDLAKTIEGVPRWSPKLESAFEDVYVGDLADSDPGLAETNASIDELLQRVEGLCRPTEECRSGKSCPEAPVCSGSPDTLRSATCSWAEAMK